jgi:MFS family permease
MPSLLRNKAFVLLAAGQAVSMFGTQVSQLALPLLVLDLTGSPAITGAFVALKNVPPLLLLLPAGAWADRWDRKRVMLLSDTARALALGIVPIALIVNWPALPLIGLAALVEGIFNTLFTTAEQASISRVVAPKDLAHALSVDNTSDQLSRMAGPTLGGLLYTLGRGIPFAVDAVSYTASVISLLFIKVPFQAHERKEASLHLLLRSARAWPISSAIQSCACWWCSSADSTSAARAIP